jgi:hypothetical protein
VGIGRIGIGKHVGTVAHRHDGVDLGVDLINPVEVSGHHVTRRQLP